MQPRLVWLLQPGRPPTLGLAWPLVASVCLVAGTDYGATRFGDECRSLAALVTCIKRPALVHQQPLLLIIAKYSSAHLPVHPFTFQPS
jgi:hypothetical protein